MQPTREWLEKWKKVKDKLPIPALTSASTVAPPTPPSPKTITLEFFNFSMLSEPINSSVLCKNICSP